MEEEIMNKYVPPKVEVNPVVLEGNIAQNSPIMKIDMEDWEPDEPVTPDTGDIYLPI